MRLTSAQKSWLGYDAANAAFALIVRSVFGAMYFMSFSAAGRDQDAAIGAWGYVCAAAGICAGIAAPYLGTLADANGRRKLFFAAFLGAGIAATLGMSTTSEGDFYPMLAWYFTALCCYMAANSFYDAMLLNVSTRGASDKLSSLAYALGYIGGLIPFTGCLVLVMFRGESLLSLRMTLWIAAAWWGALSLPLFRYVRETPGSGGGGGAGAGFIRLKETFRSLKSYRDVMIFLVAYFLYIDGVGSIVLMAVPISVGIGISARMILIVILGLQILGFPFTILYGRLANRFGARRMLFFAIGVYMLVALLVGAIPFCRTAPAKQAIFIAAAFLIGTSQGGIQSLSRSLFSRLTPRKKAAEFFGFYNVFGKFTTVIGPLLVGLCGTLWHCPEWGIGLLVIPFLLGAILFARVNFAAPRTETENA